jgi:hypothetical protein
MLYQINPTVTGVGDFGDQDLSIEVKLAIGIDPRME